jgi:hypothetical protein
MVNCTFALLASEAAVHVTVVVPVHSPGADTKVTAPGRVSVTVIEFATLGPLLVTVSV